MINKLYKDFVEKAKKEGLQTIPDIKEIDEIVCSSYKILKNQNANQILLNICNEDKIYLQIFIKDNNLVVNIWNKDEKELLDVKAN